MHQWYWSYQYPFFDEGDKFQDPKINICVFTDNLESGSNTNTNNAESSSSNYTSNAGIEESNSNSNELKINYEKIERQYYYNKSSVSRCFNFYSPHQPVDS